MVSRYASVLILAAWMAGVWVILSESSKPAASTAVTRQTVPFGEFFRQHILPLLPVNPGFDFPLRPPDGNGVFIATVFGQDGNLGENWNTAIGDGDLGESVCSIGDGWVDMALDFQSSWGNVVNVIYRLPEGQFPPFIEVMYAHLAKIDVTQFQIVKRGQKIGTVGNVDGLYKAHLRWEVRDRLGLGLGPAQSDNKDGWLEPSEFVKAHRPPGAGPAMMKIVPKKDQQKWGTDLL